WRSCSVRHSSPMVTLPTQRRLSPTWRADRQDLAHPAQVGPKPRSSPPRSAAASWSALADRHGS
ncbi:MAG: hypothetical protein AVDCRST_MAG53-2659, partial [uncultured Solirubrobacteraceae bacterium]